MKHIALLIWLVIFAHAADARDTWKDVDRIVVIGDVHGDFNAYQQVLKNSGIVNESLDWIGGNTHLVQIGDVSDRGPDTLDIVRHLTKLEKQAKRAKGRVHVLIGNHEMMNITGDLRFVHPGEYAAFVTRDSERYQNDYVGRVLEWRLQQDPSQEARKAELLEELKLKYPPGYVEHRNAWMKDGDIYRWILDKKAVIKINNILFVHAGLNPYAELMKIEDINRAVRKALGDSSDIAPILLDDGPLWYRGLVKDEAEKVLEPLQALLDYYDVDHIIVGHTPSLDRIRMRFDGKVIVTDTGMSEYYGGIRASLLIEDGKFVVNHEGVEIDFPLQETDRPRYLQQIEALGQE